jgi:hypothetical protein
MEERRGNLDYSLMLTFSACSIKSIKNIIFDSTLLEEGQSDTKLTHMDKIIVFSQEYS